ncbi:MAG: ABC transporter permease [Parachlamydia sp.]|nr:ABC transporter permease [Parachlamydia sp.]
MSKNRHYSFWYAVWKQFQKNKLAVAAAGIVFLFCLVGIYAPFLASSKPLIVRFEGQWFFPLFRYLFFPGFYTKSLDLFYNILIFTFPLFLLACFALRKQPNWQKGALLGCLALQFAAFFYLLTYPPQDPAASPELNLNRQKLIQKQLKAEQDNPFLTPPLFHSWERELSFMTPYARLNAVLRYQQRQAQFERLLSYEKSYAEEAEQKGKESTEMPILWNLDRQREKEEIAAQEELLKEAKEAYPEAKAFVEAFPRKCQDLGDPHTLPIWAQCDFLNQLPDAEKQSYMQARQKVDRYEKALAQLEFLKARRQWLEQQSKQLGFMVMPLFRPFHWEDDAGGEQALNRTISWWELTRVNRKDMVAALIFGVRVSLSVGFLAITLALLIGIPIGAMAGYYGGKVDIITYRLIEIWESMPTFFMLLMVVAFLQSKSIFLVIGVIGLFGWTGFSRFIRGEFFRQKQLPYVEACRALGYNDRTIMFSHLLPNAIPPLLTLVPFAIMGAITSEAGLSFLGLGEEGSSSWGVLMDEGRSAFPSESYLLWPPALLLTLLLVSIALVGDALRDALDPKLHS